MEIGKPQKHIIAPVPTPSPLPDFPPSEPAPFEPAPNQPAPFEPAPKEPVPA